MKEQHLNFSKIEKKFEVGQLRALGCTFLGKNKKNEKIARGTKAKNPHGGMCHDKNIFKFFIPLVDVLKRSRPFFFIRPLKKKKIEFLVCQIWQNKN